MIKILVAEDYLFNQIILQRYFKKLDYSFVICNNGSDAIKELKENDFDIVLMDIEMPIMGGIEAVTYIRTVLNTEKKSIPILALTGHHDENYFKELRIIGFNDFILKPIDKDDLVRKIHTNLKIEESNKEIEVTNESENLNAECVINLDYLNEFAQGDKEFITEMIDLFLVHAPNFIENIKTGYAENDWEKLRYNAHKFSPQLAFFGLKAIILNIDMIEDYAVKKLPIEGFDEIINKVETNCNKAIQQLKEITI
ncbi:MAG: response regulator [Bacteroidota bacterium]